MDGWMETHKPMDVGTDRRTDGRVKLRNDIKIDKKNHGLMIRPADLPFSFRYALIVALVYRWCCFLLVFLHSNEKKKRNNYSKIPNYTQLSLNRSLEYTKTSLITWSFQF